MARGGSRPTCPYSQRGSGRKKNPSFPKHEERGKMSGKIIPYMFKIRTQFVREVREGEREKRRKKSFKAERQRRSIHPVRRRRRKSWALSRVGRRGGGIFKGIQGSNCWEGGYWMSGGGSGSRKNIGDYFATWFFLLLQHPLQFLLIFWRVL